MNTQTLEEAREAARSISVKFECIDVEVHVSRSPVLPPHFYVSEHYSWEYTVATFINGCERNN